MGGRKITLTQYATVPLRDINGELDHPKIKKCGRFCSIWTSVTAGLAFAFYLCRLIWSTQNLTHNEFYYGIVAALTCLVGVSATSIAFSVLYIIGAFREQTGPIFLWLVSVLMLISLETVVVVYSSVVHDQAHVANVGSRLEIAVYFAQLLFHIVPIGIAVILYKALSDEQYENLEERIVLL